MKKIWDFLLFLWRALAWLTVNRTKHDDYK